MRNYTPQSGERARAGRSSSSSGSRWKCTGWSGSGHRSRQEGQETRCGNWRKITQAGRLEAIRWAAGGQDGKEKDGGQEMLDKEIAIDRMRQGGTLEITAHFETVAINGRAVCDKVIWTHGKGKIRAKFGNGIKAVLLLEEYGKTWGAEETGEQETGPFEGVEAAHTEEMKESPAKRADSGRKTHFETVQRWRAEHPAGSKKACARETGLSLPTIRRHWNGEKAKERTEGAAYENDGSDSRGSRGHKVRNI